MRPQLPSIRSAVLITGASASDRGWIRDFRPGFAITLLLVLLRCRGLALSLLVPRIFANHHHATVPAITLHLSQILLTLGWTFIEPPSKNLRRARGSEPDDVDGLRVGYLCR